VLSQQEAVDQPAAAAGTPTPSEPAAVSDEATPAGAADPAVTDAVAAEAARELAKVREQRIREEERFREEQRARQEQRDRDERARADAAARQRALAAASQAQAPPVTPSPSPAPAPPPSLEQRADVYLRIGLDGAIQQLGSHMHVLEGKSTALVGLVHGRSSPGMDSARPVVRAVYVDVNNRLIFLDQQRLRAGQSPGPETELRRVFGDVVVQLHGEPNPNVLKNLANQIR
jgi:hypothetical protein